jgi:sarcosine oxidase subunit alpha
LPTQGAVGGGAGAAAAALADLGFAAPAVELPEAEDAPGRRVALWQVAAPGRAWLDLQNDVTVKDVEAAWRRTRERRAAPRRPPCWRR